jgi:hypothetical protein
MAQMNIHITLEFEKDLMKYMEKKGLRNRSEALRLALKESVERLTAVRPAADFRAWRGLALKAPLNAKPRFKSDADLWE